MEGHTMEDTVCSGRMGMLSTENMRRYFFWATQVLGLVIIILILIYIFEHRGGFGGRDYPKNEFNWHIFFMVLGFSYFMANAQTAFRLLPLVSKPKLKIFHLCINSGVFISACLGLFFVIDERGIQGKSHFISLHSWIGIFTIFLLFVQIVCGAIVYLPLNISHTYKEIMMPWHTKIGMTIFLLGTAAILTGLGKGKTESERLLINFTGSIIIILAIFTMFLLTDSTYKFSYRIR